MNGTKLVMGQRGTGEYTKNGSGVSRSNSHSGSQATRHLKNGDGQREHARL